MSWPRPASVTTGPAPLPELLVAVHRVKLAASERDRRRTAREQAGHGRPPTPNTRAGTRPQWLEHERDCVQFIEGQRQELANPPVSPCGGRKLDAPAPAGQLYVGSYHRACRRAAAALTTPDRILILSALHGLLPLDRVIAPYELRMGQPGSITAAALRRQAEQLHLVDERHVIVLAGSKYTAAARTIWPQASTPLAGAGGLGRQLAMLTRIAQSGGFDGDTSVLQEGALYP